MKLKLAACAAAMAWSTAAFAQTTPAPSTSTPSTPSVTTPAPDSGSGSRAVNTVNTPPPAGAPVSGANSFTESQAKTRIESNGFSNVTSLNKDDQGIWRGSATKDGATRSVSLDFQGNVVAQ